MKSSRDCYGNKSNFLVNGFNGICSPLANGGSNCEMFRPNWYYQKNNHHEYPSHMMDSSSHMYYQNESSRCGSHMQSHQMVNQRFIQYVNSFPNNRSGNSNGNTFNNNGFGFQYLIQPSYFGSCDFGAPPPGFQHPAVERMANNYHCDQDRSYQHARVDWIRNETERSEKFSTDYTEKKENDLSSKENCQTSNTKGRQAIYEAMIQNGCQTKERITPSIGEFNAMAVSVCHEIEEVIAGGGPALVDMMDFCKAIQSFMVTPAANISHTTVLLREMILSFIHISSAYIHLSSILHMTDHPSFITNELNSLKNICSRWEEMSAMVIMTLRSIINAVSQDAKIETSQNSKASEDGSGDSKDMANTQSESSLLHSYSLNESFQRFGPPGGQRSAQRFDYTQHFERKKKLSSNDTNEADSAETSYGVTFPYLAASYNSVKNNTGFLRTNKNFPPLHSNGPIPSVNMKWRKDQHADDLNGNVNDADLILLRKCKEDKKEDIVDIKLKEEECESISVSNFIQVVKDDLEREAIRRWNSLETIKKDYIKAKMVLPFLLSTSPLEQRAISSAMAQVEKDLEEVKISRGSDTDLEKDENKRYKFLNYELNKCFEDMSDSSKLDLKHKMLDTLGFIQVIDLNHHDVTKEDKEALQKSIIDELHHISYMVYSDHYQYLSDMLKHVRRVFLKTRPQYMENLSVLHMIEDLEFNFLTLFKKEFGGCNLISP